MAKHLVIVESPTKAKTIGAMLGRDYKVESSFGHVRDLPKSALGIDVEHNFEPSYVIPRDKSKRVTMLKKEASAVDDVYFATDHDREGEAISWHLQQILKIPASKVKRIFFHEITEEAIREAIEHPRLIDTHLVDAQQARRVLDRLVGYKLSPLLWKKIAKGLSAGRVQSVALRLVVEREREIQAFIAQEYWTIEAKFLAGGVEFEAKLHSLEGKVLDKFDIANEAAAKEIMDSLSGAKFIVSKVEMKESKRSTPTPFTTSLLQQDANRRLRFSPKQTMMLAQQLYEGIALGGSKSNVGLITYMRTDSTTLAEKFLEETHDFVKATYGEKYAVGPKRYATKSKNAQEAHEAIRPTSVARTPDMMRAHLDDDQFRLYDLIWRRTVASQLPEAIFEATTIDIAVEGGSKDSMFRATGQTMAFDGFTKVYAIDSEEMILPKVSKKDVLDLKEVEPLQHFTKPPARYSEAGLVKILEEHGIGRPSTYAPTISTLVERNYVTREERRLKPTDVAFLVNDLLVENFPDIVNYKFTADMEEKLDDVAEGKKEWVPVIREFYDPFAKLLATKEKEIKKTIEVEETDQVCEKCGKPLVIKMGRFGKFFACTGFPECKNTKPFETDEEKLARETGEGADAGIEPCEKCGADMVMKQGRFGKFYACSRYPDCKNIRNMSDKKLGIKCPECGDGDVITRKTKRGKTFYGCSRYPDCKYVSWTKPGEEAPAADTTKKEVKEK